VSWAPAPPHQLNPALEGSELHSSQQLQRLEWKGYQKGRNEEERGDIMPRIRGGSKGKGQGGHVPPSQRSAPYWPPYEIFGYMSLDIWGENLVIICWFCVISYVLVYVTDNFSGNWLPGLPLPLFKVKVLELPLPCLRLYKECNKKKRSCNEYDCQHNKTQSVNYCSSHHPVAPHLSIFVSLLSLFVVN